MKAELLNHRVGGWCWYGASTFENPDNVGKFMTPVQGDISNEVQELIIKAIKQGVTPLVKHTDPDPDILASNPFAKDGSLMIIWYSTDDKESLKALAKFLVTHGLVRKTKAGRYYNISFKYDKQTRNGEYGDEFKASISLQDLMDLNTGELY
ncbi:hypothetical protein ACQRXC_03850 [Niallia taxi]|uniref:hypothetical protein n=1 Tax=Niallia taxi TaxID=2499688 RepID=UPI003F637BC3